MNATARRILVGYDGSDAGRRALDAAADLAGYGSTLAVVTLPNRGVDHGQDARWHLLRRHVPATYLRRAGDPRECVVEAARQLGAALLVVGHNGEASAAVVERAPCDVLVVR